MTIPRNRVRTKTPRSKTGCRTCRLRRVKCDEEKPACRRCYSTGRTCPGLNTSSTRDDGVATETVLLPKRNDIAQRSGASPRPPACRWYLPLSHLSQAEGTAFAFFRQHTARQLQGEFRAQLWERWAMQLSQHEPTILHAVIAVGALHQARSTRDRILYQRLEDSSQQRFALNQYTKAVAGLRVRLEKCDALLDVGVILLSCLLFVCFEMLQGEVALATDHLCNGLRVIKGEYKTSAENCHIFDPAIARDAAEPGILDDMIAAFTSLDCDSAMFNFRRIRPVLDLAEYRVQFNISTPALFESTAHAKTHLDMLSNAVFQMRGDLISRAEQEALLQGYTAAKSAQYYCYVHTFSRSIDLGTATEQILARKNKLEQELVAYMAALRKLAARPEASNDRPLMLLRIQYVLVLFHVANSRSTHECDCDSFNTLFRSAVEFADQYIRTAPTPNSEGSQQDCSFSLEPEIVPTLCLVAAKCREPSIRRRAIALLRDSKLQEAFWDSTVFGGFVQRIAEIEEHTALALRSAGSSKSIESCLDIPEEARFIDINLMGEQEMPAVSKVLCARYAHEGGGEIVMVEESM